MASAQKKLAILGAGKLGVVVAQLALKADYDVTIAGSGSPEKIRLSMQVLAPGAKVATSAAVARQADIVLLALPLGKYTTLPREALAGKLVIDAMNYWWEVDGEREDLRASATSTSELVQEFLPTSRVVKALSHMGYHHLHDEARAKGERGRKAIAVAGNQPQDVEEVAELIDRLGFDPLPLESLSAGKKLEPGTPAFGANVERDTLRDMVATPSRTSF